MNKIFIFCFIVFFTIGKISAQVYNGAWEYKDSTQQITLIIVDDYYSLASFSSDSFNYITCGKVEIETNNLNLIPEMDSENAIPAKRTIFIENTALKLEGKTLKHIDSASKSLSGVWKITHRKKDNEIVEIQHSVGRKTLKILSENRFQWIAFNSETNQFFGSGGGSYSFQDGNYIENIEFFSRDQSRVGASLSFEDELKDGAWIHTGLSSKGTPIYEVWGKN